MSVSIDSQIAEVEREIRMRKQVYPRRVAMRKMRQGEADLLIKHMEAVYDTLLLVKTYQRELRALMEKHGDTI